MLTQQPQPKAQSFPVNKKLATDKAAIAFIGLAFIYLFAGLLFGAIGGLQYALPPFLKEQLGMQKSRPLHVYLVLAWIFTIAQSCIYYFLPRITGKEFRWAKGAWIHFTLQVITSLAIIISFFTGSFGGREYLEFPPVLGGLMAITWIPFAINFFGLVRSNFTKQPASVWGWTAGIILFFLSLSESYLWLFEYFFSNEIRDITVQWKGFGTMIGSWNLLMFGCSISVMEQYGSAKMSRSNMSYAFLFVGLMNVLFNWGHHIYSLPAASWIKTVSYITSMTELLILGNIIRNWRRKFRAAQNNFYILPYRLLSISDAWITLNLILGVIMSIPQLNYYTHGTHVTVAHAMGATIGINTMIFLAAAFFILERYYPVLFLKRAKMLAKGITITNISLIIFWTSLLGSGVTRIIGKMEGQPFALIMKRSEPLFKLFALSGGFILLGLGIVTVIGIGMITRGKVQRRLSSEL